MRTRRAAAAVTPSVPGLGPLFPSAEEIADADVRSPAEKLLDGLNDAQREVVLHEAGPLACFAGAGCHRAGQLLLKYDGTWVAVEDVAVGDLLMGPDSEPRSVLRLIRGRGKMVEVAPVKGHPFVVNNDHVLTLVESVSGEVRDVVVRDVANLPKRKQWKLFRVGVDFRGTGDALPIEPYFLGVLLGDGSMSAGATVGVSKPDPEILAEVTRQAVLWGLTVRSYGAGTTEVTHFLSSGSPKGKPCKGRNPLLVALDALGLRGPSEDRFVPFCYLRASREIRLQVLAGLLDTDGSCALGGYDFISKSRKLSRDVVDLARGLGLAAYITKCRKGCQTGAVGTYWRVSVSGDCSVVPCRLPRKRAAERRQKKNVLRTGFVCRPLGEEPYFGFTLDGDGRYLLADYTVTHNSGKTKCLVHRVARLVSAGGVEPTRIFCVTFSNAGSREMNERLKKLGVPATVQTWHAFCLRVLKQEQTREGSWTVEGEPGSKLNAKLFLKKAIGYQHENWVGADLSAIRSFIGICKANLWAPEDPETTEEARRRFKHNGGRAVRVYAISEGLVEEAGFLLFDNMLTYVARLFRDHEDVRASWAAKFDHVMQDEAQDASVAQVTLARMLAKDHRNYMIVGDPSQAIYGFRGSSPKYIADFPGEWDAKVVTLATNYRSCRRVVAVANDVIRDAPYKLPEDMVAARDLDGKVEVVAANTLDDEAEELVAFVKKHAANGNPISDVAVLYRTNAQSRALEQAFLGAKIPHVIIGNVNFYERKEVKDLLAYLRLAAGADREGDAVKRCINAPFRFLGNRFVEKVQDARDADPAASWQDCVLRASQAERIQDRQRRSALDWVDLVAELRRMIDEGVPKDVATLGGAEPEKRTANAHDVLSRVVAKTRYVEWLEKEEGEESIDSSHAANVREMLRVSAEFPTVADFLAFVDKQVAESRKNKQGSKASESVTLMSVHRSKGLEWPVVWIVGCVDGVLPHAKGDPDEEQRLFYVAVTRARDHLVCSFIREMATRAGVRTVERSEYLNCFDRNPGSGADESGAHVLATDEAAIEDAYGSSFAEPPMPEQVVTRVEDPETGAVGVVHGDVAPSPEAVAAFQGIVRAAGEFLAEAAKAERESTPGTLDWLGAGACASCGKRFADCDC